jgi:hypothetical protein
MAIVAGLCDSYVQELYEGVHVSTDVYYIALYTSSAVISPSTTTYIVSGESFGTGYTAGGKILQGFTSSIDSGVAILDFTTDPIWTNISTTARGALIYNSSKANKAVAVLDFAQDVTTSNADFVVQFPAPTSTTGLIRIS